MEQKQDIYLHHPWSGSCTDLLNYSFKEVFRQLILGMCSHNQSMVVLLLEVHVEEPILQVRRMTNTLDSKAGLPGRLDVVINTMMDMVMSIIS